MNLTTYFAPVFVILLVAEYLLARRRDVSIGSKADTRTSLLMGTGYLVVNAFWKLAIFGLYVVLYELTPLRIEGWWAFIPLFFLDDLAYYWFHRAHHRVRVLWASHVVHHSSEEYNLSTALRQTWTPFTAGLFWIPLPLLGFNPVMIVTAQGVNLLYQFWIHTTLIDRLGWFEWVFNTPSHHRAHHGSNQQYLDKNYAGILIIWDRLFGTFVPETEPVRYGLTKNVNTYNPVKVAFHEYIDIAADVRAARRWRDRVGRVFAPPGWAPAGASADPSRASSLEPVAAATPS